MAFKFAHLICVNNNDKNGNNKFYRMTQISEDEFEAEWGRVDSTSDTQTYPMKKWDSIYRDKTKETKKPVPYTDVTHLVGENVSESKGNKSKGKFSIDRTKEIISFIESIMKFANKSVEDNYVVSASKVTRKQIDEAQGILNDLAGILKLKADVEVINDKLIELYKVIPRKMKKVQDHLIQGSKISTKTELDEAKKIFSEEQDNLDVMAGQVAMLVDDTDISESQAEEHDILHNLSLDIWECSPAEMKMIKGKMGSNVSQLVRAFRVINKETEKRFNKFVDKAKNKKGDLLWHGSRNENWWSIYQQGLKIRPANAVLTGSMFGNGCYYANKAQKSIGYTSLSGSYWARGGSAKAILALYEIHQGEQMIIERHDSSVHPYLDEAQLRKKGKDSVYAKGGYDLRNDEFIVYNTDQSTIRYLVEIKN